MKLFEYAYCYNYDKKIQWLSGLCQEKWSFGNNSDNLILKNYIEHTFSKIYDEGKVIETDKYALFNTGLYNNYYQCVYAYFVLNTNTGMQKWFLDGFYTDYQMVSMGVSEKPYRANYFENPSDLVFDTNCEIVPQYRHIFDDADNYLRIPESIRENPNKQLLFDGAIKHAKLMIDANYKNAVPQYYKGHIQLLIPICLINAENPDLALVVSKSETGKQYLGYTCLTLDMAYNNARLIARPDSIWLKP